MIRLDSEQNQKKHPLSGDREIEWSWVLSHLPKGSSRVLDFGCVDSPLTSIAAHLGHKVTGVDLREIGYEMPGMNFMGRYPQARLWPDSIRLDHQLLRD